MIRCLAIFQIQAQKTSVNNGFVQDRVLGSFVFLYVKHLFSAGELLFAGVVREIHFVHTFLADSINSLSAALLSACAQHISYKVSQHLIRKLTCCVGGVAFDSTLLQDICGP